MSTIKCDRHTKLWLFELIKYLVPSAEDDVGLQAELKKQNMSSKWMSSKYMSTKYMSSTSVLSSFRQDLLC